MRESFPKCGSGILPFLLVIASLNDAFASRDVCGRRSDRTVRTGMKADGRHRFQHILRAESKAIFVESRCGTML